jgi:hypothetical protein
MHFNHAVTSGIMFQRGGESRFGYFQKGLQEFGHELRSFIGMEDSRRAVLEDNVVHEWRSRRLNPAIWQSENRYR